MISLIDEIIQIKSISLLLFWGGCMIWYLLICLLQHYYSFIFALYQSIFSTKRSPCQWFPEVLLMKNEKKLSKPYSYSIFAPNVTFEEKTLGWDIFTHSLKRFQHFHTLKHIFLFALSKNIMYILEKMSHPFSIFYVTLGWSVPKWGNLHKIYKQNSSKKNEHWGL